MKRPAPELYATLQELFPLAFPSSQRDRRPLRIGIHISLVEALGPGLETEIRDCLRYHVLSFSYQRALSMYRPRISLYGIQMGEVTDEQRGVAQAKVAAYKAKREARLRAQAEAKALDEFLAPHREAMKVKATEFVPAVRSRPTLSLRSVRAA